MTKNYTLSDEIDHYSTLSDKARAGSMTDAERKEFRSMRKHLAI